MDHCDSHGNNLTEYKLECFDHKTHKLDPYDYAIVTRMMKLNPKLAQNSIISSNWKGSYPLPKIGEPEE